MTPPPQAWIVVPCYNEAGRLDADAFVHYLETHRRAGFVFVDDGSEDETPSALRSLAERAGPRARIVTLDENSGKAEAVRRGMLEALADGPEYVGFWDADLATPLGTLDEMLTILAARSDLEAVIGSRVKLMGRNVTRHARRHYLGRVFATAVSLALDLGVYDTQCGAKVFRVTKTTASLFDTAFIARWVFDVELLARWIAALASSGVSNPHRELERRIYELPLDAWHDVSGSKVRPHDFVRAAADVVRIRARYVANPKK